jgi:hypothetical protein
MLSWDTAADILDFIARKLYEPIANCNARLIESGYAMTRETPRKFDLAFWQWVWKLASYCHADQNGIVSDYVRVRYDNMPAFLVVAALWIWAVNPSDIPLLAHSMHPICSSQ